MKQYGASEQETHNEFNKQVRDAWKDMNEECLAHANRCSNDHPHTSSKSCTCDRCFVQEWIWLYSFWDCSKGFRNFHANRSCANMRLELASFAILHKQTGTFSLLLAWRDLILHFNPLPVICNWKFGSNSKNAWFMIPLKHKYGWKSILMKLIFQY